MSCWSIKVLSRLAYNFHQTPRSFFILTSFIVTVKKLTQTDKVYFHERHVRNITYGCFLSILYLHKDVSHSFWCNHVIIWKNNGSPYRFIKIDKPIFVACHVISISYVEIPNIGFVLSQIYSSHQNELFWIIISCMFKLSHTFSNSIWFFIEVAYPSIMSKLFTTVAFDFLHIVLLLQSLILRSIILSSFTLTYWNLGWTITLIPLLLPPLFSFIDLWRIFFHFLEKFGLQILFIHLF